MKTTALYITLGGRLEAVQTPLTGLACRSRAVTVRAMPIGTLAVHTPGKRLEHGVMAGAGENRASVDVASEGDRVHMVAMQRPRGALAPQELTNLTDAFARKVPPAGSVVDSRSHGHPLR